MYNKFCWWMNFECQTYRCCHFCDAKNCQSRCKDDLATCKYSNDKSPYEDDYKSVLDKPYDIDIKLLKVSEVASMFNVKYDDIYLLVTNKTIETVKVGSRFFIEETQLDVIKQKLDEKSVNKIAKLYC